MSFRLKTAKFFGVSAVAVGLAATAVLPVLAQPDSNFGKRGRCSNMEQMSPEKKQHFRK